MSPNQSKNKVSSQKSPVGFTMIVKPDCLSQGKGIFLTKKIEDVNLKECSVV